MVLLIFQVAIAIIFYFISPGASFFTTKTTIRTNVWHPDLVRVEHIVPRKPTLYRGFVPIRSPAIRSRVAPAYASAAYTPSFPSGFAPIFPSTLDSSAPAPALAPALNPALNPYLAPAVPATAAPPTLPPLTTTTAAATTLPPPPPPTTTAPEPPAPAVVVAPAAPAAVEAPAPQVITVQQPAPQGLFPQGIIAVQPIITNGGLLNIGNSGEASPGGLSQFLPANFLGSALLQALLAQQAPAAPVEVAAPPAPEVITEAPTTAAPPETTIAPAIETTVAPVVTTTVEPVPEATEAPATLPPTPEEQPLYIFPSQHGYPGLNFAPGLLDTVLQPPALQAFQYQSFESFANQIPAQEATAAPLPEISPSAAPLPESTPAADQQQFVIRVEDVEGGQSYSGYNLFGQQQLLPAANPQILQGEVYSNQVHVSTLARSFFYFTLEKVGDWLGTDVAPVAYSLFFQAIAFYSFLSTVLFNATFLQGAGAQFDYSFAGENRYSRGTRKYRSH